MKRANYLKMKTEDQIPNDQSTTDLNDIANAAKELGFDAIKRGGLGLGTTFFQWLASIAAIYLLVLDRTQWKTNILTGLLSSLGAVQLSEVDQWILMTQSVDISKVSLLQCSTRHCRGDVGMWIAFIAVILRLFFPRHFPDWLELPGAIILIIVVAPSLFAYTIRGSWLGAAICLVIGCYLLQEHIRASGGFRNSFGRAHGISNTVGIILLLVYPVWYLIICFL
ncbi:hypothetical protein Cgig2_032474 [Carnegiea gigantea]|uniref:Uncharacterized protein n=1 Tax=Carnegiea gigantea TaxID=171969 RepID=A0A9Q1KXT1_9CARY|nr:hypothetical protein Cgig2_032474 [Carnegiea gigantea]